MHTGNMPIRYQQICILAVYPCAYREHSLSDINPVAIVGLSLCIQGTCLIMFNASDSVRFIPVHTGNILVIGTVRLRLPVYPCAYREHIFFQFINFSINGLSLCIQGTCSARYCCCGGNSVYPCAYREHTNYNILFYN